MELNDKLNNQNNDKYWLVDDTIGYIRINKSFSSPRPEGVNIRQMCFEIYRCVKSAVPVEGVSANGDHYEGRIYYYNTEENLGRDKSNETRIITYKIRELEQLTKEGKKFLIFGIERTGDNAIIQECEVKIDPTDHRSVLILDNQGHDPSIARQITGETNPYEGIEIRCAFVDPDKKVTKNIFFVTPHEYEMGIKPDFDEKNKYDSRTTKRHPYNMERYQFLKVKK